MNKIENKMLERRLKTQLQEFTKENADKIFKPLIIPEEYISELYDIVIDRQQEIATDMVKGMMQAMLEKPNTRFVKVKNYNVETVLVQYHSEIISNIVEEYIADKNITDITAEELAMKLYTTNTDALTDVSLLLKSIFGIDEGIKDPLEFTEDRDIMSNILDLAIGVTIERPDEPDDKRPKLTINAVYETGLVEMIQDK